MRLFAAVDPPAAPAAALARRLGAAVEAMRYVPPEQWHITTAFYGDVPDEVVPELLDRLGRAAARTPPLTIRFRGLGTFPAQASKARVLWAGVAGDLDELTRLAERCTAAGRRCGLAMEDRRFRPHLTLARARREPVDLTAVVAGLASYDGEPWQVRSLRLVRSTLGPSVVHETLHDVALSGHQA